MSSVQMLVVDQRDYRAFGKCTDVSNIIPYGVGGLGDQLKGAAFGLYIALAAKSDFKIDNPLLFDARLKKRVREKYMYTNCASLDIRSPKTTALFFDGINIVEEKTVHDVISTLRRGNTVCLCTNVFTKDLASYLFELQSESLKDKIRSLSDRHRSTCIRHIMLHHAMSTLLSTEPDLEIPSLGLQYRHGSNGALVDSMKPIKMDFIRYCASVLRFTYSFNARSIYITSDSTEKASLLYKLCKDVIGSDSVDRSVAPTSFHTDDQYNSISGTTEDERISKWIAIANDMFLLSQCKWILTSRGEFGFIASCIRPSLRLEPIEKKRDVIRTILSHILRSRLAAYKYWRFLIGLLL